jgi:2-hydroxy-6-oxonona-2,4-dienedioate hydrolase
MGMTMAFAMAFPIEDLVEVLSLHDARSSSGDQCTPTPENCVADRVSFARMPERIHGSHTRQISKPGKSARWRWMGISILSAAVFVAGAFYLAYSRDMQVMLARMSAESEVTETRHGLTEFTTWGSGPAVLVVHGAGGGYDQGRAIARAFGGENFRWIAPSRFGYLRTPLPDDASTAAQADVFAELLDTLAIDRVAILAMSGGVPPSLQFALRHPARTSALVLLSSAPYTPLTASEQQLPVPIWMYQALFGSDLPYWILGKVARPGLETIFDVKPGLRAVLTPREKAFVALMVDGFEPVTRRTDGLRNEAAAIDPKAQYTLEAIKIPTLVIHARDDGINPFAFGEYTARRIPGAELMPLTTGGHLLLGHHAEVRERVNWFLHEHAPGRNR